MIKLKDILKELGEGSANPYPYTKQVVDEEYRVYTFTTEDGDNYEVRITQWLENNNNEEDKESIVVDFGIKSAEESDWEDQLDMQSIMNKGRLFKIMATLVKIIKQEIKTNPNIKSIEIHPSGTYDDKSTGNKARDQRAQLYLRYIKANMPQGSKVKDEILFSHGARVITVELP